MKNFFLSLVYILFIFFNFTNYTCYAGEIDDDLGDVTFGVDSARIELDKEMKFSQELIKKEFIIKGKVKILKENNDTYTLILDDTTYKYLDMNLKEFNGKKAKIELKSGEEVKLSKNKENNFIEVKGKLKNNGMFYINIIEGKIEELKIK